MSDPSSLTQILWSEDPATRRALWTIAALVVPIALAVFLTPIVRAVRLYFLEGRLRDTLDEYEPKGKAAQRGALREWLRDSALQRQFAEFERRWTLSQLSEGTGRAPIRLLDVLEDQPLLPIGPRRSLLPVLPGLFLGIGVFGALFGLIPSVAQLGDAAGVVARAAASGAAKGVGGDPLALQLGLALRATAWGFAAAIAASAVGRLVEGSFDARGRGFDEILAHAYEAVSPGELAEITRHTQQKTLDTLGRELTQFAHELNERLERGLQRIEQSSSRAASLVSQEQRGALHTVVQELSLAVRQGVDHHLAELRGALQRAVDYQSSVTNGLSETYERMVENAQMQDRVARTLGESANALDAATRSLRSEIRPVSPTPPVSSHPIGGHPIGGHPIGGHPIGGQAPEGQPAGDPVVGQVAHGSFATGARLGEEFDLDRLSEGEAIAAQIAQDLGQALRGFTEQITHIDETIDALRREIREDGRLRRETLPEAPTTRTAPIATPPARPLAPRIQATPPPLQPAPLNPPGSSASTQAPAPAPAPAPIAASAGERASADPRGADIASADGPIGRELSLSGFRVGAPRAQGPDPYERLASGAEPPSNVRHFPNRERELGDELKLSGLLGPSGPARPAAAPERRPDAKRADAADEQD